MLVKAIISLRRTIDDGIKPKEKNRYPVNQRRFTADAQVIEDIIVSPNDLETVSKYDCEPSGVVLQENAESAVS